MRKISHMSGKNFVPVCKSGCGLRNSNQGWSRGPVKDWDHGCAGDGQKDHAISRWSIRDCDEYINRTDKKPLYYHSVHIIDQITLSDSRHSHRQILSQLDISSPRVLKSYQFQADTDTDGNLNPKCQGLLPLSSQVDLEWSRDLRARLEHIKDWK